MRYTDRGQTADEFAKSLNDTPLTRQGGHLTLYPSRGTAFEKSVYVYTCISKIATEVAGLDYQLMRHKNREGEAVPVPNHPALKLLQKPNPAQTKAEFIGQHIVNRKIGGAGFIYKVRNKGGKVVEMWNLNPALMKVLYDETYTLLGYRMRIGGGKKIDFAPSEIIHTKHLSNTNPFESISPLGPAASRIDTEDMATRYQANIFRNSARPDALLYTDDVITDQEEVDQLRRNWDAKYGGPDNAHKTAVLAGGVKYQQVQLTAKDVAFFESLALSRDDIAMALGVPKALLTTDKIQFANYQTAVYVFLGSTVKNEAKAIIEKLNQEMVATDFDELLFYYFPDPTPQNVDEKKGLIETAKTQGLITVNEGRRMLSRLMDEDLPDVSGGDEITRPVNVAPFGAAPTKAADTGVIKTNETLTQGASLKLLMNEVAAKAAEPVRYVEDRKAFGKAVIKQVDNRVVPFEASINKFLKDQRERAIKALEEFTVDTITAESINTIFSIAVEKDKTRKNVQPFIAGIAEDAGEQAFNAVEPAEKSLTQRRKEFTSSAALASFILARSELVAASITETTWGRLSTTLAEGIAAGESIPKLTERIEQTYESSGQDRALLIARTEATAATNRGFQEGWDQSSVVNAKEWLATQDGRTRPTHSEIDGEVVKLGQYFSNGFEYPSEPNCRCTILPVLVDE